jgi:glyoxylase-like metal-dependent hydrolase (beta-lactamase superfamily II)
MRARVLAGGASVSADSVVTTERTVTKLADGVYVIRHADPAPGFVNGNTTVIVGDQEVLVVDACFTSAAAREDIAEIRRTTDRPVRYVLNTHWHQDHAAGDSDYLEAFPGAAIVAQAETAKMLASTSPTLATDVLRDGTKVKEVLEKRLSTGKAGDGSPLTPELRQRAERQLAQVEDLLRQAKGYRQQLPTLTFDRELTLDLGGREADIRHWGRGNTSGDAFVYLPKEKILVAGDLLVHPVPYAFDGYPGEWIETLRRLDALDARTIVPGHGEVLHDEAYLHAVIDLLESVVAQVDAELRRNTEASLEDVQKAVDLDPLRQRIAGDDTMARGQFDLSIREHLVGLVYHELKQR